MRARAEPVVTATRILLSFRSPVLDALFIVQAGQGADQPPGNGISHNEQEISDGQPQLEKPLQPVRHPGEVRGDEATQEYEYPYNRIADPGNPKKPFGPDSFRRWGEWRADGLAVRRACPGAAPADCSG